MKGLRQSLVFLAVASALVVPAVGQERPTLRVAGWNLESGESDPDLLRQQMGEKRGIQVWGLSEVQANAIGQFERGAEEGEGSDYAVILGTTGNQDRLAIVFDTNRLEQVGQAEELRFIQLRQGLRAPLVAHFRGRQTGQEFLFMVNHLKRGEAQNPDRIEQARLLNRWARDQTLPVIACGDYNFDFDVARGDAGVPFRDRGFDAMTQDGIFTWVRPERLVKTNADDDFNTVLDFIFVANPPFGWTGESRILEREGDEVARENDFDDSSADSDHRPVDAVFVMDEQGGRPGPGEEPRMSREEILRRIDGLEAELRRLREAVRRMEDDR